MPLFIFKINKLGIFYFYLNNLALEGKKFWVRKNYNQEFISSTGQLTKLEKEILMKYQKTVLRLEKKDINLSDFFYRPNPWMILKKKLSKKDYKIILKTFELFRKRWNSFWNIKLKNEVKFCERNLIKNVRIKRRYIEKIVKNLYILYNPKDAFPKKVVVFLIPLPKTIKSGGGKFIPSIKGISIEGSAARMTKIKTIQIVLHELIHLYFEKNYRKKLIEFIKININKTQENQLRKSLNIPSVEFGVREIIATSLTIKMTAKNKIIPPYQKLLFYTSQKLQPLINYYLKNKKPLDENFTKEVLNEWHSYSKI